MLIDTHAHIHFDDFKGDLADVFSNARTSQVGAIITVGTTPQDSLKALDFVMNPDVIALAHGIKLYATAGIHPHEASLGSDGLKVIGKLARNGKYQGLLVAIGECGLDYFYDHSDRAVQREIFAAQIALAHQHKLSLVIHTREAWDETFEILDSCGVPERTIFYCFTGSPVEAKKCLDIGAYLSFSGIVTFKKAQEIRDAAKICSREKMLVETDSPFLAPVPHRGKSNQPAFLVEVGACLAEVRNVSVEEIARQTTQNATIAFPGIAA